MISMLDLPAQDEPLREAILQRFRTILETGQFILGPYVEAFEQAFARQCGTQFCIGLNSGTSALHLALLALGIQPGDEVITTPMTFVATTWAISYVGARPVFVDIDPGRRTLDPNQLEDALTPRTKAILPVHLYGQPADLGAILDVAQRHQLPVIEDAAQAHFAQYQQRPIGSFGAAACFSFYPGKNLGAYGEGGAITTNDPGIAARCRMLRDHGQSRRYHHETIGFNYRMDALQGAVLDLKLPHLAEWTRRRQQLADYYDQRLAQLPGVTIPQRFAEAPSVFHLYVIEVEQRDRIQSALRERGIITGLHYPIPIHRQNAYLHLGYHVGSFPYAERLAERCLSLPLHPTLTESDLDRVCDALTQAVKETL